MSRCVWLSAVLFGLVLAWLLPAGVAHASSDIEVGKSGPTSATADADVTYTITLTNRGPDASTPVQLRDAVPANTTFVSGGAVSAPDFTCTPPMAGSINPAALVCDASSVPANATATFTMTVHIDAGAPPGTVISNSATATVEPIETGLGLVPSDPNEDNNSAFANTFLPAAPQADVRLTKTAPLSAPPDTNITYTLTLTNGGPAAATGLTLTDELPTSDFVPFVTLTFVSLQQTGTALSCTSPAVGASGTITCTAATYASGASTVITLVAHVPSGAVSGHTFSNVATVTTSSTDPVLENNSGAAATTVGAVNLSVTKSGPASAANTISYTITVANSGPDAALDVTLADAVPTGTTFMSLTRSFGPDVPCTTPTVGGTGSIT